MAAETEIPVALSAAISARRHLWADLALLAVVTIWGATFVMVQDAVRGFPVFAFLALRFLLATIVLVPLAWRDGRQKAEGRRQKGARPLTSGFWFLVSGFRLLASGLRPPVSGFRLPAFVSRGALMGIALCAGYGFQTMGLRFTTPAKAGFITGLCVALVPVASALFLRRSPSRAAIFGVALATVGLGMLSLNADWRIGLGDLLVLCCAISFAAQIILTAAFAPGQPAMRLALVQIATVAVICGAIALIWERPWPALTGQAAFAAVFTGVLATSFAFATQTVAQRFTSPTHTALIFSLEPVMAAIFSFLLIGESLTPRAIVGCALILTGMLIAEAWNVKREA